MLCGNTTHAARCNLPANRHGAARPEGSRCPGRWGSPGAAPQAASGPLGGRSPPQAGPAGLTRPLSPPHRAAASAQPPPPQPATGLRPSIAAAAPRRRHQGGRKGGREGRYPLPAGAGPPPGRCQGAGPRLRAPPRRGLAGACRCRSPSSARPAGRLASDKPLTPLPPSSRLPQGEAPRRRVGRRRRRARDGARRHVVVGAGRRLWGAGCRSPGLRGLPGRGEVATGFTLG